MKSTVLGIDGSTPVLSLAVVEWRGREPRVLARWRSETGADHAALLPGVFDNVLSEAGLSDAGALDAVVVGLGPGAFTGLRVALASAKGLAYARKIPLVGASSLEAMARAAAPFAAEGELVVPLLDARKQEVYAGFYRVRAGAPVGWEQGPAEQVLSPDEVIERLRSVEGRHLFGLGFEAHREKFVAALGEQRDEPALAATPLAEHLAALAGPDLPPFAKESLFALEPRYLRGSGAERAASRRGEQR